MRAALLAFLMLFTVDALAGKTPAALSSGPLSSEVEQLIDELVSRTGTARERTRAFLRIVAADAPTSEATRIEKHVLRFLSLQPLTIQRTLGKPLFDADGHYKDPVSVILDLFELMRRPANQGGRNMDDERILLSLQNDYGLEGGSRLFAALKSGRVAQLRSPSVTSADAPSETN